MIQLFRRQKCQSRNPFLKVGNTDIDLNNELDASFVELLSPKSLRKRTDGRLRQTSFTTYSAKQKKRGILFSKKVLVKLFFSAPLCFLREGHKYNTCLINFAFLCWMRQPPNKMTKGGLSSRVQWVAKVLEHLWRVTSTQQFEVQT